MGWQCCLLAKLGFEFVFLEEGRASADLHCAEKTYPWVRAVWDLSGAGRLPGGGQRHQPADPEALELAAQPTCRSRQLMPCEARPGGLGSAPWNPGLCILLISLSSLAMFLIRS